MPFPKVDLIIVGGGIANTFLAAAGKDIGKSLYEPGMIDVAKEIMDCGRIVLPTDAVVSSEIDEAAAWSVKKVDEVSSSDHILDIGPLSISKNRKLILMRKLLFGMVRSEFLKYLSFQLEREH